MSANSSPATTDVAVVGGGASGLLVVVQLLVQSRRPLHVTVFEPRARLGSGVAFSTTDPTHLLNVPASRMSGLPDRPDDLVDWAGCEPDAFIPRARFGDYLRDLLATALRAAPSCTVAHVQEAVASVGPDSPTLTTESGRRFDAHQVILATGHDAPELPRGLVIDAAARPRIILDPWDGDALAAVTPAAHVVCIGTGLTFVDVALSLAVRDLRTTVHGVSRTGAVPYAHEDPWRPPHATPDLGADPTPRQLAAWIEGFGPDWRRAVDALRPATQPVWRAWDDETRGEFVSTWSRRWDVRRHRMAPGTGRQLERLRNAGRITTGSGGVARIRARGGRLLVSGGDGTTHTADHVVICTGPTGRPGRAPLLAGLERHGLLSPGPLGLGISADPDTGQVRDPDGGRSAWLSCLGPLLRGELWESIAIPELRCQARDVAAGVRHRLDRARPAAVATRRLGRHLEEV